SSLDSRDRYPTQVPVAYGGSQDFISNGVAYAHFRVLSNELGSPKVLICPQERNGNRGSATNFASLSETNVSYFVGVDAQDIYPQMWLSGDANFAISNVPIKPGLALLGTNSILRWNDNRHKGNGNICFADGSAQQLSSAQLPSLLRVTGDATNRLAMP